MQNPTFRQVTPSRSLNDIARNFQHYLRRYGYQSIELPVIELADLFLIKAGDQVVNKLFTVEHQGRQFALRPEFTAAAAYHYITSRTEEMHPIERWQFQGYVFEDDPDANQNVQRFSLGAELIGMKSSLADAEIIAVAANGLSVLGLENWQLTLGDAELVRRVLHPFALDSRTERFLLHHLPALKNPDLGKAYVTEQVSKLLLHHNSTVSVNQLMENSLESFAGQDVFNVIFDGATHDTPLGGRTRHDIAHRLLQKRKRAIDHYQIIGALDALAEWSAISLPPAEAFSKLAVLVSHDVTAQKILAEWWQLVHQLKTVYEIDEKQITIQPALARSWDYYTGVLFELKSLDGRPLGGGGRYDELIRLIGGRQTVPAVGFAYYVDNLVAELSPLLEETVSLLTISYRDNLVAAASLAQKLREYDFAVQVLPANNQAIFPLSTPTLFMMSDDKIAFNDTAYSVENIGALIAALRQVLR